MKSILRPYLYREKVASPTQLPMAAEELLPGRLPAPFWGWFDAMLFQNIGNRVVCQQVSEVGKCALNPAIPPASIFLCHASDQRSNFSRGSWSSGGTTSASIVSLGDQLSVPSQQSLRSHNSRNLS